MSTKKCSKCGEVKGLDCFCKNKTRKDGLHYECKTCLRHKKLRRRFNISPQYYDFKLLIQNNACEICKQQCPSGRRLAVDHCHNTGQVRGLLCVLCNQFIGNFQDSPELLLRAAEYIESHQSHLKSA